MGLVCERNLKDVRPSRGRDATRGLAADMEVGVVIRIVSFQNIRNRSSDEESARLSTTLGII